METDNFSETASTNESTRRQNQEEHHPHRRENLKSHIGYTDYFKLLPYLPILCQYGEKSRSYHMLERSKVMGTVVKCLGLRT
jgi:hypothetical protein